MKAKKIFLVTLIFFAFLAVMTKSSLAYYPSSRFWEIKIRLYERLRDYLNNLRKKYSYAFVPTVTPTQKPAPTATVVPSVPPNTIPSPTVFLTPTPTASPKPTVTPEVLSSWLIQSVSSMKETKDRVCNQRDDVFIAKWVTKAKELGANFVALETPYDSPSCGNSVGYTQRWTAAIRAAGLKVWHRHMPLAFEGIYDTPKQKGDFLNLISNYIKNNADLFKEGDIFTPIPEPQNGGIGGVTHCSFGTCVFDNKEHFNYWLRTAMDTAENAFSEINLTGKIKIGYYGFDGFVAWGSNNPDWDGILEDATIQKMGNLTIDHYPELIGQTMKQGLDELHAKYPAVPIIIGEWGSAGNTSVEQQVLESMGAAKRPQVVGFNYWHLGLGGNEALINEDFTNRAQFDEVQSFFKTR